MDSKKIICTECNGEGSLSRCCNDYIDEGRCGSCGRFSKEDVCIECEGRGDITFSVNSDVEIFVCVYTDKTIKDKLYNPKKLGDNKTFTGKIVKIINDCDAEIKIKYRKDLIVVPISELTLI